MNDDDKKAYRDHEARQEAIYERKMREAIKALETRYDSVCRQLEGILDEFSDILEGEGRGLEELARLTQCLEERRDFIFGNLVNYIGPAASFAEKPTFKNMLYLQIYRLESSSDLADKSLVQFLQKTIQAKKYKPYDWWGGPDKMPPAWEAAQEALALARSKKISQSQAAMQIAKNCKISKRTIENFIIEVKREEARIHAEVMADFAEFIAQENPTE